MGKNESKDEMDDLFLDNLCFDEKTVIFEFLTDKDLVNIGSVSKDQWSVSLCVRNWNIHWERQCHQILNENKHFRSLISEEKIKDIEERTKNFSHFDRYRSIRYVLYLEEKRRRDAEKPHPLEAIFDQMLIFAFRHPRLIEYTVSVAWNHVIPLLFNTTTHTLVSFAFFDVKRRKMKKKFSFRKTFLVLLAGAAVGALKRPVLSFLRNRLEYKTHPVRSNVASIGLIVVICYFLEREKSKMERDLQGR